MREAVDAHGRIDVMINNAGLMPQSLLERRPGFAVYAATKHAVRALSEGLRREVKPYNIRATVISPGAVGLGRARSQRRHHLRLAHL